MRVALPTVLLALILTSSPASAEQTVYALEEAPCYNGPSKSSGRFFFSPTAKAPTTLMKDDKYVVLETRDDWSKVQLFPSNISQKTAWVESKYLATARGAATEQRIARERLQSFNELEREGRWKSVYAGVEQDGKKLTFHVKDSWNRMSKDLKEAFVRDCYTLFFSMGGPRNIQERPEDFTIEVRHSASHRLVATWDALFGFRPKD